MGKGIGMIALILCNRGKSLACKFILKDAETLQPVDNLDCSRTVILKHPSASANPETQLGFRLFTAWFKFVFIVE